jgi:membrane-bound lytic murein transglycosylase MltF
MRVPALEGCVRLLIAFSVFVAPHLGAPPTMLAIWMGPIVLEAAQAALRLGRRPPSRAKWRPRANDDRLIRGNRIALACEHTVPFGERMTTVSATRSFALGIAVVLTAYCVDAQPTGAPAPDLQAQPVEQGAANAPDLPDAAADPRPFQDLDAADILNLNQRWAGDYDGLAERRFLRVLVPYSRTLYYLDGPEQKGIAYEALRELEPQLPLIGQSKVRPKIVIIPTTRDRLLPALAEGYGDVAIGAFAITDLRREIVEFSAPTMRGIENVVVTGKGAPAVLAEADLAGAEIYVQRVSSYYEDLVALNERLTSAGLRPVSIQDVDAGLEEEDVLQMVDAGIIPATVSKRPVAEFWAQLYDQLVVHSQVALRSDGQIAWALRKDAPQIKKIIDGFVVKHRAGTLFGNVLLERYLGSVRRLKNPMTAAELEKYRAMAQHFRVYADRYGSDWLLAVAQGYQESELDHSKRSPAGAIGVMQIKPSTAADRNVDIDNVEVLENNIHASIKYMGFLRDRYFREQDIEPLDQGLFTLAAYNAGPARVAELRQKAAAVGLDPNRWFGNVEIIAARVVGRETVDYVGNVYKYYSAYKAVAAQRDAASPAPE